MPIIIDGFKRQIDYLRISVTDRCNLRCIYCIPQKGVPLIDHSDILSYEELLRITRVTVAMGIKKIRITGGEPLVRKEITGFISELYKNPSISDISMTTNGILLKSFAGALRSAGLKRINISLDTLKPERYKKITRGGDIKAVMDGISEARQQGFNPIKINVVVMRGINDDEVCTFAGLTLERPVHIRFIEFMPIGITTGVGRDGFISNNDIMRKIEQIGRLIPNPKSSGPAQMFQLEGAQGKLGFVSPLSNHFCATCNRLRITADGKLRTCLFSDIETDLKTPLRSGCSDGELQGIIKRAVLSKPQHHGVFDPSFKKCARGMFSIGG